MTEKYSLQMGSHVISDKIIWTVRKKEYDKPDMTCDCGEGEKKKEMEKENQF